jgi:hypothetical protein
MQPSSRLELVERLHDDDIQDRAVSTGVNAARPTAIATTASPSSSKLSAHLLVQLPVCLLTVFSTIQNAEAFGAVLHVDIALGTLDASTSFRHFEI